ncbi:hypothetical protein BIV25_13720 [Streptomyces sp. MUSC 14]|uniref:hypothetical protein n=1 Tax=Streptomyces sp. MUSC 14 TaxID=1354889 RepID=UPI0008F5C5FE|nr:hypothetical protein [Streptomyces sp. MUSC 14]OIJ97850.1 hypothetical protein BIV25_13720 [Streptomyces sp. MUSC 14]
MGIESDKVVYEYLSRVGDIAQQRQLPSSTRMRLVSELRNEIDRHRARVTVDSPAAVRRILDRLGSPDDVVEAAGGTSGTGGTGGVPQPPAAVPVQPAPRERKRPAKPAEEDADDGAGRPKGLRRVVPRPRSRPRPADPEPAGPSVPRDAPSPARPGPVYDFGDDLPQPEWWRTGDTPFGGAGTDSVPGFVGGVEIPEMLRRPQKETAAEEPKKEQEAEEEAPEATEEDGSAGRRRLLPLGPAAGWTNPLLLLAAAALVAGAVLGNWFALLLGWVIAYGSRRLTAAETRTAVMILPGAAVAAGLVWLWGRQDGRWGQPIAQGHMGDAVAGTWPWVVRGAAIASALFLVWRSQRRG